MIRSHSSSVCSQMGLRTLSETAPALFNDAAGGNQAGNRIEGNRRNWAGQSGLTNSWKHFNISVTSATPVNPVNPATAVPRVTCLSNRLLRGKFYGSGRFSP